MDDMHKGSIMKICFAASSGGHLEELNCLKPLTEDYTSFLVTEDIGNNNSPWEGHIYYLRQMNRRERFFFLHFILLFFRAARILRYEKPDCIISTGALITYPFCLLCKLRKKKVIYIESFARVDEPSLTGKLMYPIADLFLVQWEDMLKFFPKAMYVGSIF